MSARKGLRMLGIGRWVMKKSNYVHALLWASAVVASFYLETFWYAKIRYIREVSFFDYRLTIIAVSMLIFTISMLLIYKIQERESKKNMSKEKQIEEMALELCRPRNIVKMIHHRTCDNCDTSSCDIYELCVDLYNADYRKQSEWISVEERLPQVSSKYICALKDKRGNIWTVPADWSLEMKTWFGEFGELKNIVTHWMPLPEAPKGGAVNE
jgi:hypothetical protein